MTDAKQRRDEIFPDLTEEQVDFREKVSEEHHTTVATIQRRGLYDRIVAKLRHWEVLEEGGYPLGRDDKAEVVLLKTMLADISKEMEAAGQPVSG